MRGIWKLPVSLEILACKFALPPSPILENKVTYSQNRFTDTRLIRTPHYYEQFALSLGKGNPYFFCSKFNPLNTDSRTFYGLLIVHINGLWLYLSFKDLYFCTVKFVSRLNILTLRKRGLRAVSWRVNGLFYICPWDWYTNSKRTSYKSYICTRVSTVRDFSVSSVNNLLKT